MDAPLANAIFLSLFHLWLVAGCLVFSGLALWDLWRAVREPHDWGDHD